MVAIADSGPSERVSITSSNSDEPGIELTKSSVCPMNTEMILEKWKEEGKIKGYLKCVGIICKHNPMFTFLSMMQVVLDTTFSGWFVYYGAVILDNKGSDKQIAADLEELLIVKILGACILLSIIHITSIMTNDYQPIMYKDIAGVIKNKEIMLVERMYSRVTTSQSQAQQVVDPFISALSQSVILVPQNCAKFISTFCLYCYCGYVIENEARGLGYALIPIGAVPAASSIVFNIAKYREKDKNNCKSKVLYASISAIEFFCPLVYIMSFTSLLQETDVKSKISQLSNLRSFVTVFFVIAARYSFFNKIMVSQCTAYKAYCDFVKYEAHKAKEKMKRKIISRGSAGPEDVNINHVPATE